MQLISDQFAFFVILSLIAYFCFPKKHRWIVLLTSSFVYYIIICNKYVVYMLVTIVSTYFGTLSMYDNKVQSDEKIAANRQIWSKEERKSFRKKEQGKRRRIMIIVLVINFGILGVLKYFGFVSDIVLGTLRFIGFPCKPAEFSFLQPLGISFYTFQVMGYLIDVYQEKVVPQRNIAKVALFTSFFSQIIQGPIGRYEELGEQLYEGHDLDYDRIKSGALLVLWGLLKKLLIADRAVIFIDAVKASSDSYTGIYILIAVLLYALQLYADFSGGIDIVRGIAQLYGINMAENFRRPYFARSLTEYWHRWHISLCDWVRNYIFYPLSISKPFLNMGKYLKKHCGKHISKVLPTSLASIITFVVIGLWHGANGKYLAFGLWNGIVIMLAELIRPVTNKADRILHIDRNGFSVRIVEMLWTFILVLIGYYFDVAGSSAEAMNMLCRSVTDFRISDLSNLRSYICISELGMGDYMLILAGAVIIFAASLIQETRHIVIRESLMKKPIALQWAVIITGILIVSVFGYYGSGVKASDFVYMQF